MRGQAKPPNETVPRDPASWLNRDVVGMGLTSLLADAGYEMANAVLPGFLAIMGVSAAVFGAIEGIADSVSSFVKLGAGWLSDRLGRRKPMVVGGYMLTGVTTGLFALAHGWPLVLVARTVGWFGRGVRGPLRDAMLAESIPAESRGKAFGFHRASDTVGAILGPLVGVALLAGLHERAPEPSAPFRTIFLVTLIPGITSALAFAGMVREKAHEPSRREFWAAVKGLPSSFRRFLWGAGVFGAGDFAHTLMILAATQLLAPGQGLAHAAALAGLLYVAHNFFYAASAYPMGALSDLLAQASRWGRRGLLAAGYVTGALAALGLLVSFNWHVTTLPFLLLVFALAGISIGVVDALEGALTADLVAAELRGTAYGIVGTVNGVGDLVSSVVVGGLWTAHSPALAFAYAAATMTAGAAILFLNLPAQAGPGQGQAAKTSS